MAFETETRGLMKLKGSTNYESWHRSLIGYCKRLNCWNVLIGEIKAPVQEAKEDDSDFRKRKEKYSNTLEVAEGTLLLSLEEGPASMIADLSSGPEQYKRLVSTYKAKGYTTRNQIWQKITRSSLADFESAEAYGEHINKAVSELKDMGYKIDEWQYVSSYLHGLGDTHEALVDGIIGFITTGSDGKDVEPKWDDVRLRVTDAEKRHNLNDKPKILKAEAKAKRRPKDGLACYTCGSTKHLEAKCWEKHPDLAPNWWDAEKAKNGEHRKKNSGTSDNQVNEKEKANSANVQEVFFSGSQRPQDSLWYLDSGASIHMTYQREVFEDLKTNNTKIVLADGSTVEAVGVGIAEIPLLLDGEHATVKLSQVHYCPDLDSNLLSLGTLESKGLTWSSGKGSMLIRNGNKTIMEGFRKGTVYVLSQPNSERAMATSTQPTDDLWHRRLGHLGLGDLKKLEGMSTGMKIEGGSSKFCEPCVISGQTRKISKKAAVRALKPFKKVHIDLCGGGETLPSKGGVRYFLPFTDDCTRYKDVSFLKNKTESRKAIKDYIARVKTEFDTVVACFRADNAKEFKELGFQTLCEELGIQWEWAAPYAHNQNGVAERANRTIATKTRALLRESGLSDDFWVEAMKTAVFLLNRSPTKVLKTTPYEALRQEKPDLSQLHVFGCSAYVYDEARKTNKLENRSWKGVFLGYEGTNQYRIYNPKDGLVYIRRDVVFQEDQHPMKKAPECQEPEEEWEFLGIDIRNPEEEGKEQNVLPPMVPNQEEALSFESETSELDDEEESEEEEEAPPPERRSGRSGARVDYKALHQGRAKMAFARTAKTEEITIPKTYEEAIDSPEAAEWTKAMWAEFGSLEENKTWKLVKRPEGTKTLKGRWVYKIKPLADGTKKYKARWVVKGFAQREGIDYDETFAPVVRATTNNILFALVARLALVDDQMDVVTAFLNPYLEDDIWMEQPEGFGTRDSVCKLLRTLYGLKQSPREWYKLLRDFLVSLGFVVSKHDHGLFVNAQKKTYIAIYVDDIRLIGPDRAYIDSIKKALSQRFKMTDLGPTKLYLGMEVTRNTKKGTVTLTQSAAIRELLKAQGMENSRPASTPMDCGVVLMQADEDYTPNPTDVTAFKSVLGKCNYLTTHTRPDLSNAISKLSRYSNRPDNTHWQALKHVLRYLAGTIDEGIIFGLQKTDAIGWTSVCYGHGCQDIGTAVLGYTDSSYACDVDDSKSTCGYVFMLNGGPISWISKKQETVATSTCHAEYIGQYYATGEAIWLRGILAELGHTQAGPTTVFADNQGAIKLSRNPEFHKKSKHIDVKYHFSREVVEAGKIKFEWLSTDLMAADGLTKPLTKAKHTAFVSMIGMGART